MDYLKRIQQVQKSCQEKSCDAFLITNLKDILYLTGFSLSSGRVLVTQTDSYLIVDGRYFESCESCSPIPVFLAEKDILWKLLGSAKTLGLDSESVSYQAFTDLKRECNERSIALIAIQGLMQQLRTLKTPEEMALLGQAADLGSQGFDYLLTEIKEGITEEELADSLWHFWKKKGATGFSFSPIIAFGPSSSMPHYRAGKGKLKNDDIILLDIGVELNHYNSDMTRVVFFGNENPELTKIHGIVLKALQAALSLCRPGITVKELDIAARSIINAEGYGARFTHSLGHGVGLDIHESPALKQDANFGETILEAGMVITIEPGIYLPGIGGVRLEDMIAITSDGYENLTNRPYTYRIHV